MVSSRKLDLETLRQCGMTLHVMDYPAIIIENIKNPQAAQLTRTLLDFNELIPKEEMPELKPDEQAVLQSTKRHLLIFEDRPHRGTHPLEYGHYEHTYRNGKLHNISDRIIWAYAIVKGAEAITTEDETKWSDLMNFQVFRDFRDIGMATENRREISELTDRGMSVRVEREHQWDFGRKILRENSGLKERYSHGHEGLTAPKPDLYMAFNANLGYNPWGFDYLGLHVLAKRSKSRGLLESFNPGPCIDFSIDGNPQPEDMKNFSCFPWLIGEWKHAGEIPTPTRGHCQAANAAAVALSIMASVAAKGKERPDVNDIWPVFAITSTGHRAKVWIAYISKVERSQYRYEMHKIWEGHLTNFVHVAEFCHILESIHYWAVIKLQPSISTCIAEWSEAL